MRKNGIFMLFFLLSLMLTAGTKKISTVNDELSSWSNTKVKKEIISYINEITDKNSLYFIPEDERFAVFDNDGTLWAEKPVPEEMFIIYYAEKMVRKNPKLKNSMPFNKIKDFYENGKFVIKDRMLFDEIVGITHRGMTKDEFRKTAEEFFREVKYPKGDVPMSKIVYQPQLELMNYLRKNGFKVYICSGGETEFMRAISKEYYGIPEEQVIGSELVFEYDENNNTMTRNSKLYTDNNGKAKANNTLYRLGRPAVFAVGNVGSGGDIYMLRYSQASKYKSFQLLINHDDEKREFLYNEKNGISLKWAEKYNWNVVSMKDDWKQIFPGQVFSN